MKNYFDRKRYRLVFKTADDCLLLDRFMMLTDNDPEFLDYSLAIDARQKGVKVVRYEKDEKLLVINVLVAWL